MSYTHNCLRVFTIQIFLFICFARCQCPQGWRENEDKCYYFSADTKSWSDANTFCSEQGSDLLSIRDIHERVRCCSLILNVYWIGLNDRSREGVWEWSDGSPFLEYIAAWIPGQPDNWGDAPGEDCGQILISKFKYFAKNIIRKSDIFNIFKAHAVC
uniref:C-type lectin domain-containing protein n=1 Tax=Mola mola TaxID=94237 RepID=A0A3Q3VLX8_MOLML